MSSDSDGYDVSSSDEYFNDDGPASQCHTPHVEGVVINDTLPTPNILIPMTSIDEESIQEDADPDVATMGSRDGYMTGYQPTKIIWD